MPQPVNNNGPKSAYFIPLNDALNLRQATDRIFKGVALRMGAHFQGEVSLDFISWI
jgi:hypothetical protein